MARRGNQQKNRVDRRTSKHTSKVSESGCANPNSTGQEKTCDVKVPPGDALPNGHHPIPGGSSTSDIEITSHSSDGRESPPQHSRTFQSNLNQGIDEIQEIEEPVSSESTPNHCSTSSLEPPGAGEGSDILHGNGSSQKHTNKRLDYLLNHLHLTSILMVRNLWTLYSYSLKTSGEWLERQRPSVVALTNMYVARDYVKLKIGRAYPVLLKCLAHFGNILLLLSMVWLDCALRGIGSFLHMSTASFFSVIWLSIFSVVAMAGTAKFLIVLVSLASTMDHSLQASWFGMDMWLSSPLRIPKPITHGRCCGRTLLSVLIIQLLGYVGTLLVYHIISVTIYLSFVSVFDFSRWLSHNKVMMHQL